MNNAHLLINKIDALLPQTQCTKCGFNGCRPYAEAILEGTAINRCPPGGSATIARLANLLCKPSIPLDTSRGQARSVIAVIREDECIGCTKCIQACPVDAIIGATQHMHTVVSEACTGCELCVDPCPVDCIDLVATGDRYRIPDAQLLRKRHENRKQRLLKTSSRDKAVTFITAPDTTAPENSIEKVNPDELLAAHTAYIKAEKIRQDAESAANLACKRGRKMVEYQQKLERLASTAATAKENWLQLKQVAHSADRIA